MNAVKNGLQPLKVLVTGASGFIGDALVKRLSTEEGWQVLAASRTITKNEVPGGLEWLRIPDLGDRDADFRPFLQGVDCVVHTAGLAHLTGKQVPGADEYFRINSEGTLRLAQQARECGASRFVFLSTIGVNGSSSDVPLTENSRVNPENDYALSKYQAELGLREFQKATGLEVVVIRPPLVFGCGAPGNFRRLLTAIEKGVPLPFGSIDNMRTLIGIDNLCDFIVHCMSSNEAGGNVFLIGEEEDVSTAELCRRLSAAYGRSPRVYDVPTLALASLAKLVGKGDMFEKLSSSLLVSSRKARDLTGWKPVLTLTEGLRRVFGGLRNR